MEGTDFAVPMRLQKFLARSGVASRRGSEDLMTAGRVTVNGIVATELGTKVDPSVDIVAVDGRVVQVPGTGPVYLALNKPIGYITTMSDPKGRPTVAELVFHDRYPGLFPVGRLDQDSRGLLLFTTDGELSHRLLHPRWKVVKRYEVTVDGAVAAADIEQLRSGIQLDDGLTAPAEVELVGKPGRTSRLTIRIREGRKRQVRRMCSAVGHPVLDLFRSGFGPIQIGDQEPGSVRHLTEAEIVALRNSVRACGDDGVGDSGAAGGD